MRNASRKCQLKVHSQSVWVTQGHDKLREKTLYSFPLVIIFISVYFNCRLVCRDNLIFIGMYDGRPGGRSGTADSRDHCVINAGILRGPPELPGFVGYFTIIVKSRPANSMAVISLRSYHDFQKFDIV